MSELREVLKDYQAATLNFVAKGLASPFGIGDAEAAIQQLIDAEVVRDLEGMRLDFRSEDPGQYRPNDMISLGTVEEYINDAITQRQPKEGL